MLLYPPQDAGSSFTDQKMEDAENNNQDDAVQNHQHHQHHHQCSECGEEFPSAITLQQHRIYICKTSTGNTVFAQLNREFMERHRNQSLAQQLQETQSSLESGIRSGDSEDGISESSFNSERWKGVEGEDGERHFPCENCDKTFTDPSNLQRHIRAHHVGARSHACKDCGKTFATSSGLKQHQHIHSSVKPFQCEVCLKAYTQFSNLCRHKRMHADCRQQIKCKECGQAFSTVTSLSKHKRFCEGAMRNGTALAYQNHGGMGSNIPKPATMPPVGLSPTSQPGTLPPGYINFYNPRPPYPSLYPPIHSSFPSFPPTHPLAAMQMAALSGMNSMIPPAKSITDMLSMSHATSMTPVKNGLLGSDGNASDLSPTTTNSDSDNRHSDNDLEDQKSPPLIRYPNLRIPVAPSRGGNVASMHASLLPGGGRANIFPEQQPYDLSKDVQIKKEHVHDSEKPFDLSKACPPKVENTSTGSEKPLDLSVKTSSITGHKTHVFGDRRQVPKPAPKLEHPKMPTIGYQLPNPLFLDPMYRVNQAKFASFHEATKMMAYAQHQQQRFVMANSGSPYGSLATMGYNAPIKDIPTMMKLSGKPADTHHHQFSPYTAKMKERYSCKFCGKIFPRSANLTRHLRTHTGEQPYKCKYCERSFSISSNLQRHVRNIHNKEKPFKCPLCDRCFGQQTNLDRHLKKHESDGPIVIDSPPNRLDEKEDSYFDEIRNFIDKTETETPDSKIMNIIDPSFSLTSRVQQQTVTAASDDLEKNVDHELLADDEEDIDVDDEISVTGDIDDDVMSMNAADNDVADYSLPVSFPLSCPADDIMCSGNL